MPNFADMKKEELNMTYKRLFCIRTLTVSLLVIITLLLALISCQNNVKKRLCQNGKMWYFYCNPLYSSSDIDSTSKYLVRNFGCFIFKNKGELLHVVYNEDSNQYEEYKRPFNDPWDINHKNKNRWDYNKSTNELIFSLGKHQVLAFVEDTLILESHGVFNDYISVLVNLGEEFPKNPNNKVRDHFDRSDIIRLLKQGNVPNDSIEKYIMLDSISIAY